jgi:hypothetical protein
MTLHLQYSIRETLDCLIQRVFINLDVVHDNIDLRLHINLFLHLHNAISGQLYGVFHILVHLTLVAYKDNM